MTLYLDTRGQATYGIGICARCQKKFPLAELGPDPNAEGLMVCTMDRDVLDPYRLPARSAENITLPFNRPDVPLYEDPKGLVTEDDNYFLVEDDQPEYYVP